MAQHGEVERLFHDATGIPEAERSAFLRGACAGDEALRLEVESLLAADRHGPTGDLATGALDQTGAVLARSEFSRAPRAGERVGDSVGPYHLLDKLGEGGFGVVWLAERREPMVQRVALKIIKPGMDSEAVIARFEQERQTLALMDHPTIAKVFDAGATPAGRPYFVMELVEGTPITDYCDGHVLTTAQRLALFAQVCDAVQHAHTKGVIHRDLKPSNILVGHKDGRPVPKVIDFGIAKAIDQRAAEQTIFTQEGQLIGTPEYMSPEQAGGEPDIDTRTDVYALGVVLYEMLTGLLPFDPRTLRAAGYAEIQRIIREVDPPRPSTRLSALGDGGEANARKHGAGAGALARELRRELEWVPLRAMRKQRAQRYATAKELGDDVRNYLAGRPLAAGPDSAWYTVRKVVRRHRVAVVAGACIIAAVIGGAGLAAYWAVKESRARRTADAVNTFTNNMLGASDPRLNGARRPLTIREAIEESSRRLDGGELRGQPEIEFTVRTTMGNALFGVGEPARSEQELRKALDLAERAHGEGSLQHAAAMHNLGEVLLDSSRPGEAERLGHDAAALRTRLMGKDHPLVAASRDVEAIAMFRSGRPEESRRAHEEILSLREQVSGRASLPVAETLTGLGNSLWALGRVDEASERWTQALEIFSAGLGADHPYAVMCTGNLASAAQARGHLDAAESLAARAVEMARRVLGASHQDLATYLAVLAAVKLERGDASAALTLAEESAELRRQLLGDDNPALAESLAVRAGAARRLNDLRGSADDFERAAAIYRRRAGAIDHERLARALAGLGGVLTAAGDAAGGAVALDESAALFRGLPDHPLLGRTLSDLAYAYLLTGPPERAVSAAEEALALLRAPNDDRARTLLMLATAHVAMGRAAEAEPAVREAVTIRSTLFPAASWQVASARSTLGAVLTSLGGFEEAQTELLAAFDAFSVAPDAPAARRREAAARLAALYGAWGKAEERAKWLGVAEEHGTP